MSEAAAKLRTRYTWSDYRTWNDDQRWEIVGGDAYLMAPAPLSRHQMVSMELSRHLANHFKGKPCRVMAAPTDVVLSEEDVVQPDLLVVCDPNQIKRTHIEGAPTLVVEILSGSSEWMDRSLKLALYARAGVKEYWLISPCPSYVEVLVLDGAKYRVEQVASKEQELVSPSFPDLKIVLRDVFDFPLEPGEEPTVAREPPSPAYRSDAGEVNRKQ
jgi:Uma2 family endonuclease